MLNITEEKGAQEIFNLPVYRSEKIATAVSDTGQKFTIYAGLHRRLVEQLKAYSLDTLDAALQKTTRDHARFGLGSYEDWYGKGKTPFALVADTGEAGGELLAALVWYGPKKYPLPERQDMLDKDAHTAAYRSYNPFRGKHLMEDFSRFTQNLYLGAHPGIILWLETSSENGPGLFKKLGFKETGEISPLGKTVMVYEK